jgi:ATP/maltotriose-dependent transcriptional regulator MalT
MAQPWWKALFRPRGRHGPLDSARPASDWSEALRTLLDNLALLEERPREQVHEDLITSGLAARRTSDDLDQHWKEFTRRERHVVALVCNGYTNRQIAGRLGLATPTVKTHIRHVLHKLALAGRADLRLLFADWDFSGWTL